MTNFRTLLRNMYIQNEYGKIEQKFSLNRRMPNCTTVVETANDFLNPKFNKIRPTNDTFRPFIRPKKLSKSFGIVQLIVKLYLPW